MIPLADLTTHSVGRLLAYPSGDATLKQQRLDWLGQQGVEAVYGYGPKAIAGFPVLGLGYCGLVILVRRGRESLALKLRRSDSPSPSFAPEAAALALANGLGVGPQLMAANADAMLMEHLAGPRLLDWLQSPAADFEQTWMLLQQLLEQAFRLDQAGLDHGDLRCVTEHGRLARAPGATKSSAMAVLASPSIAPRAAEVECQGDRPRATLIDFSRASRERRPANVTSLTQGLFLSTAIARTISQRYPHSPLNCQNQPRRGQLIAHLRQYKSNPADNAYKSLLIFLKA
jgi:putative serine/threonine protein kinase